MTSGSRDGKGDSFWASHDTIQESLRYHIQFENLVARMSTEFVNLHDVEVEPAIVRWLGQIGSFAEVGRCYIFQPNATGDRMRLSHEWCADGIVPQSGRLQDVPMEVFGWAAPRLLSGESLHFPDVNELPKEAKTELATLLIGDVKSWLCVPLVSGKRTVGALGFDSVLEHKTWNADLIPLVNLAAQAFANVIVRQRTERTLVDTERRLRSMIENTSEIVFCFEYDPPVDMSLPVSEQVRRLYDGQLVDCNHGYLAAHGISAMEDAIGRRLRDLTPQGEGSFDELFRKMIEGGYRMVDGENRQLDPDGTERFFLNNAYGVLENRTVRRVWGTFRDITARKLADQALLKKEQLDSLGVLAGGIAHDFNNLLVVAGGFVDMARRQLEPDHVAVDFLAKALSATARMTDLTRQLLTFAKGGEPLMTVVDIDDILRETSPLAMSGSNVRSIMRVEDGLFSVLGDAGQLSQVFSNILINARQSMVTGGKIEIYAINRILKAGEVAGLEAGAYAEISIADQGTGIAPENLKRIFDPFFTTKQEGSGLGLATTYSIVQRHRGHISVESEIGEGTAFRVLLPAAGYPVEEAVAVDRELPPMSGRVLLMDDEELVREVTSCMLEDLGFQVSVARHGEEAVDLYRKAMVSGQEFDWVILDITIPGGMGGEWTIEELRSLDSKVRAIVSSGYADSPLMARYREFGFVGVLPKPYTVAQLAESMAAAGTRSMDLTC